MGLDMLRLTDGLAGRLHVVPEVPPTRLLELEKELPLRFTYVGALGLWLVVRLVPTAVGVELRFPLVN